MHWLTRKELVDVITQVVFTHLLEPFIRSIETEHGQIKAVLPQKIMSPVRRKGATVRTSQPIMLPWSSVSNDAGHHDAKSR